MSKRQGIALKCAILVLVGAAPAVAAKPESNAALRQKLLAPYRDQIKRIVFTKHFDMGGSHHAYTDAVSDEDTLNPNGTVKEIGGVALDFMATDIGRKHGPSTISDLVAWDVKVVLGESPVPEDGSAAFAEPRTPVYFQVIDAEGHVVQTMRSWSTLMPGEVFSCIGCHENKEEAVAARPATMALQAGIQPLEPFYDITGRGFSFPQAIQPILDAKCARRP
jgi:hypothetical protein